MALSDLAVYSEYAYSTMTEVLDQQIALFNEASRGTISLTSAAMQGDYSDVAFFKKISGLVRRRNAYGSGTVTSKKLEHLVDTMVKVAAGTPPVQVDPGQFRWIQMNPETAGAVLGQQLAGDAMADMLNTSVMAGYAALSGVSAVIYDATSETTKTLIVDHLIEGAAKFGDRSQDIQAWVCHSKPMHNYWKTAGQNAVNLFTYGSIAVMADPFGRPFIVSDCAALKSADATAVYHTLGLVPGAISVGQNNDFDDNWEKTNGDENIQQTYQAEWSFNLGIKGFSWDKTNGGKSPNDSAIATATNWDKYASSNKDIAGVVVQTN